MEIAFPTISVKAQTFFHPKWGGNRWTVFGHYYAITTPIPSVQRPTLLHLVSLECICNLGWIHSIHSPRYWGCQIGRRSACEVFHQKITHHTKSTSHHDASHGIIGHEMNHNNNSDTTPKLKFCAESVFDVGWA